MGFPVGGRDVIYWKMDTDTNNTIALICYVINFK